MRCLLALLALFAAAESAAGARSNSISSNWFPKVSCEATSAARSDRKSCLKTWTVLVYMNADEDLRSYAFWDLYEMESAFSGGRVLAGSTARSDLVVELDDNVVHTASRYHIFQSEEAYRKNLTAADFEKSSECDVRSPVVLRAPEIFWGGDPEERFRSFISWGIRSYPSEHYIITIWGHGMGWRASTVGTSVSFAPNLLIPPFFDSEFLDHAADHRAFDTRELGDALAEAATDLGRPLDIVVSDACLMQSVEVAEDFSTSARFVVGSSQILPYRGLPYRHLMYEINADLPDAAALASDIPKISERFFGADSRWPWMTMSAVSGRALRGRLDPALQDLGDSLQAYLSEDPNRAISVQETIEKTPEYLGSSRDLGLFLSLLEEDVFRDAQTRRSDSAAGLAVEAAILRSRSALQDAIVGSAFGTRYSERTLGVAGFAGLSVWLPEVSAEYRQRVGDFSASPLFRRGDWPGWLAKVFGGAP